MGRSIRMDFISPSCVLVRGYGSRALLVEARGGRPPAWSTIDKAWTCQTSTAYDVVAIAERHSYDVTITGVRPKVEWPAVAPEEDVMPAEEEVGLW